MSKPFTCPLSPGQEQIWFLQQLAPEQCAYNLTFGIRLHGALDVAALRAAVGDLVRRHEILRTTIDDSGAQPLQVVAPEDAVAVELPVEPAEPPAGGDLDATAFALLEAQANTTFDPRVALLRLRLYRLADEDHLLAVCMHHLISDAGSYRVVMRDLAELYRARHRGVPPQLPNLAIQYADYAMWQRGRLTEAALTAKIARVRRELADLPELELRADSARPPVQTFRGETIVHRIPDELLDRIEHLSRTSRSTLYMTLVSAFQVLLARYTGQDEIVVGSLESGRLVPDVEELIGEFVNSVVLRIDLSGDPSFTEVRRRVRGVLLDAADNADVPFDKLVEGTQRKPDRNPIFQVAISQLPEFPDFADFTDDVGIDGSIMLVGPGGARFDLNVNVYRDHGGLRLYVEYSTDLFAADTIKRMLGHYERILAAVVADPTLTVSRVPMLSDAERAEVLHTGQGRRRDYPAVPVHQLVSEQAGRTPDALAIAGTDILTYAELDRKSDILARYLRRVGVGHEDIVGVAIERSAEALASYLAVSKAGGAYLPLDPSHPHRRLNYIVDDAGASVVLARGVDADRLPNWSDRDVVVLDRIWPRIAEAAGDPLPEVASASSPVYVLYTSGSTGNPKGVMVEHGALANYITWMADALPIAAGDRMFQYFSLVFDVAHGDIFATLAAGATSVLVPPEITLSPPALGEFIREWECTYVGAPPAMLALIPPGPYPALRSVLVVGEPFPGSLVNRWNTEPRRFVNLYGPTEATVGCTSYVCDRRQWQANPPIGRPIDNMRIYLVDAARNLVPVGVPGEVLIAGPGLARGYLGRPELTAEKFIDDPFVPGERAYRSGDRAAWTSDGQLRFLGRIDNQVKLHSQRVELGEIEAALTAHRNVRQAAVVVHTSQTGVKRLVAYVVPAAGTEVTAQQVRDHLAGELPAYMIPASYLVLDELPLGPSGKLNRAALPEPADQETARLYTPPRTISEQVVADAYAEVLTLDKVGATDDFFALGGTSLQVAAVINQIKQRTGVLLALRDLYAVPTVEAVAGNLRLDVPRPAETLRPRVVALRDGAAKPPLFCLPHVFGDSLAYRRLLDYLPADQPLHAIEPPEPSESFDQVRHEDLTAAYLAAVRTWHPGGPYLLTGHSMGATTAFEMALQLSAQGIQVAQLILIEPSIEYGLSTRRGDLGRRFVELLAEVAERPAPRFDPRFDPRLGSEIDAEFFAGLLAVLDAGGLAEPGLDSVSLAHRFRGFAANMRALRTYRPAGTYPGHVVLVRSAADSITTRQEWERRCAHVDEVIVPGDHFSIWNEPNVAAVATVLTERLTATAVGIN